MLDCDYSIATRTGLHCAPLVHQQLGTVNLHGSVRFSIGPFNTDEHVEVAIPAVAEISQWQRDRKRTRLVESTAEPVALTTVLAVKQP